MKPLNALRDSELSCDFNAETPGSTAHEEAVAARLYRRTSDICPATRTPFGSEYPPISPKMHELRERCVAQEKSEQFEMAPSDPKIRRLKPVRPV
jgi:hypothetical protein